MLIFMTPLFFSFALSWKPITKVKRGRHQTTCVWSEIIYRLLCLLFGRATWPSTFLALRIDAGILLVEPPTSCARSLYIARHMRGFAEHTCFPHINMCRFAAHLACALGTWSGRTRARRRRGRHCVLLIKLERVLEHVHKCLGLVTLVILDRVIERLVVVKHGRVVLIQHGLLGQSGRGYLGCRPWLHHGLIHMRC